MTTHILEVAERMADRIGVIAHGKLIAEGTLEELRLKAGKTIRQRPRRRKPGRHFPRAGRRDGRKRHDGCSPGTAVWFAGTNAARLARLARHDDGRPPRAPAPRRHRHRRSSSSSCISSPIGRSAAMPAPRRQSDAGRDHRERAAVVAPDDLAGDGIDDARFLFALRSRSHPWRRRPRRKRSSPCASSRWRCRWRMLALPLAAPFIDVLIALGGWRWLGAYGLIVAMGAAATALAVGLTVALFRVDRAEAHAACRAGRRRGDRRRVCHRPASGGDPVLRQLSRVSVLQSQTRAGARARCRQHVLVAGARRARRRRGAFRRARLESCACSPRPLRSSRRASANMRSPRRVPAARRVGRARRVRLLPRDVAAPRLRRKEWTLLRRDPWLVSQTLMQMLYLIPPAVLLWRSFDDGNGAYQLLVPVLVMAAGQLAGGLAWLAISGEDAPDLVASAPVPPRFIVRAKIEAVLGVIAVVFAPLVAVLAIASPWHALVTGLRHRRCRGGSDFDPALVPHPGQAQSISPPPGVVALGDLRRGVFVDRLGRNGGGRRRQSVARRRAGSARAPGGGGRMVHEPAHAQHG